MRYQTRSFKNLVIKMSISWPNIMFDYSDKLWVSQMKVISAKKKRKHQIQQRMYSTVVEKRRSLSNDQMHTVKNTHKFNEAIRSALLKLRPALHLVKFPDLESNDRSVPRERTLVPITAEKLTIGFAVKPTLVLIPA